MCQRENSESIRHVVPNGHGIIFRVSIALCDAVILRFRGQRSEYDRADDGHKTSGLFG